MSELLNINPDQLAEYKQRAEDLFGGMPHSDTMSKIEGVTMSALTTGIALSHAGFKVGKIGDIKNLSSQLSDNVKEGFQGLKQSGEKILNQAKGKIGELGEQAQNYKEGLVKRISSTFGKESDIRALEDSNNEFKFNNPAFEPETTSSYEVSSELENFTVPRASRTFLGRVVDSNLGNVQQEIMDEENLGRIEQDQGNEPQSSSSSSAPADDSPTTTLKEPGSADSQEPKTGNEDDVNLEEDQAIKGDEALEQGGEAVLKDTASNITKSTTAETLGELTAESSILDDVGIGDVLTVGLALASVGEELYNVFKPQPVQPIVQSGQQLGVS